MALLLVRLQRWKEAEETGQKVLDISRRLVELDPNNLEYRILLVRSYHVKGETVEFSGRRRGDRRVVSPRRARR